MNYPHFIKRIREWRKGLGAKRVRPVKCVLYKDVGGVYTADPKLVPEARLIPEISYEEMMQAILKVRVILREWAIDYFRHRTKPIQ